MITLGIRIGHVRLADAQDLFQNGAISQRCPSQLSPILPLATGDDVVDGSQRELLMCEMTVLHGTDYTVRHAVLPSARRIGAVAYG